jgi:hypothetical protein
MRDDFPLLRAAAADLASGFEKVFDRRPRPSTGKVLLTGSDLRGAIYAVYQFHWKAARCPRTPSSGAATAAWRTR